MQQVGGVLVAVSPWDEPALLTRSWCLWEIHCAQKHGVPLAVAVPPAQRAAFRRSLLAGSLSFIEEPFRLDVSRSDCFDREARAAIRAAAKEGGSDAFNKMIERHMRRCFLDLTLQEAQEMFVANVSLSALYTIGLRLNELNDAENALVFFEQSMALLRMHPALLPGPEDLHRSLAMAFNGMARSHAVARNKTGALAAHAEALAICRTHLNEQEDSYVGQTFCEMGVTHVTFGHFDEALACLEHGLGLLKATLDENHREIANTYGNIGIVLCHLGFYTRALDAQRQSLQIRLHTVGESNPETAQVR